MPKVSYNGFLKYQENKHKAERDANRLTLRKGSVLEIATKLTDTEEPVTVEFYENGKMVKCFPNSEVVFLRMQSGEKKVHNVLLYYNDLIQAGLTPGNYRIEIFLTESPDGAREDRHLSLRA